MKKFFAIFLTFTIIACILIPVFAAPSPTTSAVIGSITVETDTEEIVIPKENIDEYLNIIHVHEAEEETELYKIGELLKKDDKFDDNNLAEVIGEDFDNSKLIQLYTIEKVGNIDGDSLTVGEFVVQEDGSYKMENPDAIVVKGGKIVIKLDCPSVNEDMDIRLVQYIKGQWVQAEHVRAYNGYITFDFDLGDDIGTVWAVTVNKVPVSPPTGETLNAVYFALFTIAVIGTAIVTRKYLAQK